MELHFAEDFFKEEKRKDFVISEPMKRYWAHCLQILEVIDEICSRHNIKYFASWGTLLGAVREGGFIPWDDDVDITMLRVDYTAFVRYAAEELPAGWTFKLYHDSPEQFTGVHRVYECPNIRLSDMELSSTYGCPFAAGVDVFILDDCPESEAEMSSQVTLLSLLYGVAAKLIRSPGDEEALSCIPEIESITGMDFGTDPSRYADELFEAMELVCAMYDDMFPPIYGSDRKVRDLAYTIGGGKTAVFKKSYFADTVMLPFEGIKIPAPAAYDAVLRGYFGDDYMTPIMFSADHGYPVYRNQ